MCVTFVQEHRCSQCEGLVGVFPPCPVTLGAATQPVSELWMCWDLGSCFSHRPLIHNIPQHFHVLSSAGQR